MPELNVCNIDRMAQEVENIYRKYSLLLIQNTPFVGKLRPRESRGCDQNCRSNPGRAESQPWVWTPEPCWYFWNFFFFFKLYKIVLVLPNIKTGVILGGLWRAPVPQSFMSQCKEFGKSKMIGKKWFITIGYLWGFQAGGWEMACPGNLLGYSFIFYIIKGKVGRRRGPSLSFLSRCHVFIISSSSRLGRGVFLSLRGQARSTNYCFLCAESMS